MNQPPDTPTRVPDRQRILDFIEAQSLAKTTTEAERLLFIETAVTFGLDPFRREIHALPATDHRKFSLVVGYESYLKRAEATGLLDGWTARIEGTGPDLKAVVEIHRRGWDHPVVHEAYFEEVVPRNTDGTLPTFWERMPRFQLKKVAIVQAFRMAFSEALGGLPYDPTELGFDPIQVPVATQPAPQAAPIRVTVPPTPPTPPARGSVSRPEPTTPETTRSKIESLMTAHPALFNDKHRAWVTGRFESAGGPDAQQRMLGYVEKTIRNAASAAPNHADPIF